MVARLKVLQGKPHGKVMQFNEGEWLFGRGPECHVRPNSDWVSRQHFMLKVRGEEVTLRDLGSANGTLVNGRLVTGTQKLEHGDKVQLGPLVLELLLEDQRPKLPLRDTDTINAEATAQEFDLRTPPSATSPDEASVF